ncbi:hypothetical protein ASPZODRAFT_146515 [Penicilliopsis zonata CBS 506.65]|uniref:3'-5' exonuclease domain-containing protein n=1 Tax=Penicilliopsis zonata CBS 506.65 TaxID=1073090 RepID=A0A1L9S708_9EURO|nr:hypothetical protein ASPZODRAFT_146515 [Penicilliopsis zonata CBS 506.65]OJJ42947.1 hypothetical protein ASPZODRAFT_146515 [Penicilliopsis zonata CBS 506.65]
MRHSCSIIFAGVRYPVGRQVSVTTRIAEGFRSPITSRRLSTAFPAVHRTRYLPSSAGSVYPNVQAPERTWNIALRKTWVRQTAQTLQNRPSLRAYRLYSTSSSGSNVADNNVQHEDCIVRTSSGELESEVPCEEAYKTGPTIYTDEACTAEQSGSERTPEFWSHTACKGPDGKELIVHYCKSLRTAEAVAQLFLTDKLVGFDMEWKAQASSTDSIQANISLIQIANEQRIALFHLALFRPARHAQDLLPPSLRLLLEDPQVTKTGVAIKADCTRLRKFLGVHPRAIFELSHLFKLLKYGRDQPALVNRRAVNLSDQVEEHFGLPLDKDGAVRCGDWMRSLDYRQVQYAASDPYACLALYNVMDAKRKAMCPVPPLPAHADLGLPIRLTDD